MGCRDDIRYEPQTPRRVYATVHRRRQHRFGELLRQLSVAMSRLCLCPPRDTHQKNIFQYKEIETCTHVFLRRIAIVPPLTAPYDGPYKVVARSGRVMKILIKGKVETVKLDRVKPAHLECEPTTGPTTQRTTPTKKQSSKTTRIASRNPQDP